MSFLFMGYCLDIVPGSKAGVCNPYLVGSVFVVAALCYGAFNAVSFLLVNPCA